MIYIQTCIHTHARYLQFVLWNLCTHDCCILLSSKWRCIHNVPALTQSIDYGLGITRGFSCKTDAEVPSSLGVKVLESNMLMASENDIAAVIWKAVRLLLSAIKSSTGSKGGWDKIMIPSYSIPFKMDPVLSRPVAFRFSENNPLPCPVLSRWSH